MSAADTPDIVERLRGAGHPTPIDPKAVYRTRDVKLYEEAADTILALRAAQSPQAREEGGAVEGWVMAPREPHFHQLAAGRDALGRQPSERVYDLMTNIYRAMLAAAPSPPQAPQDVAGLLAEAKRSQASSRVDYPGALDLIDRLAAALTGRELTDEEAERGARVCFEGKGAGQWRDTRDSMTFVLTHWTDLSAQSQENEKRIFRAACRAITETP